MKQPVTTTVIIPSFNATRWIARTIDSVLADNDAARQIIVVDDGSTDNPVGVLGRYSDRITAVYQPNMGPNVARNAGLAMSEGEFVFFLDSDDYILPGSLPEWVRDAHEQKADFLLGPFAYEIDGERIPGRTYPSDATGYDIAMKWASGLFTPPCAVIWRTEFLRRLGGWSMLTNRATDNDGELVHRALICGARVGRSGRGLGVYVQHSSPDRVSKKRGETVVLAELNWIASLDELASRTNSRFMPVVARLYYNAARRAFIEGFPGIGREGLSRCWRLDKQGAHYGSVRHKLLSGLLGLERKEALSATIRRIRRSVSG